MHNVGPPSKNSTTAWLSLSLCHHLTLIKTLASSFRLWTPFYYFLVSAILFWLDLVVPLKAMLFELESLERASRGGKEQIEVLLASVFAVTTLYGFAITSKHPNLCHDLDDLICGAVLMSLKAHGNTPKVKLCY